MVTKICSGHSPDGSPRAFFSLALSVGVCVNEAIGRFDTIERWEEAQKYKRLHELTQELQQEWGTRQVLATPLEAQQKQIDALRGMVETRLKVKEERSDGN